MYVTDPLTFEWTFNINVLRWSHIAGTPSLSQLMEGEINIIIIIIIEYNNNNSAQKVEGKNAKIIALPVAVVIKEHDRLISLGGAKFSIIL